MAEEMVLYGVIKKKADNDVSYLEHMLSVHDNEDVALQWAQKYCLENHNECYDLSTEGYLHECEIKVPIYGRYNFMCTNVFFIRRLAPFKKEAPSFPPGFEVQEDGSDYSGSSDSGSDGPK